MHRRGCQVRWPKGREKPKSSKHSAQRAHTEAANEKAGNEKRARRTVSRTTQSPPTTSGSPVQDLEELSQSRVHAELEHKSTWSRLKVNILIYIYISISACAHKSVSCEFEVNQALVHHETVVFADAPKELCKARCNARRHFRVYGH